MKFHIALRYRYNIIMMLEKDIMIIDAKIGDEKLQYEING